MNVVFVQSRCFCFHASKEVSARIDVTGSSRNPLSLSSVTKHLWMTSPRSVSDPDLLKKLLIVSSAVKTLNAKSMFFAGRCFECKYSSPLGTKWMCTSLYPR